ncbi:uncharacterized protein BHQ10_004889 [Talaromyces amestolkiae]|uniref:DUF1907 domain-containing protein n=1 Tax=Talaromyces amestolkiae TaxID=1196081 RepID=A0A364KZ96_TALAM|nr:uncharacterized protein BHQ10_004889 [Talaromyces amestolkiae]RAO68877.1 hypothetical protein BHQ10_004889 [Talaromyces amestolkiae]
MNRTQKITLSPPPLSELAETLQAPLSANYEHSSVSVVSCPNLRESPFLLAHEGLSGDEKVADVGGQTHLYPRPMMDKTYQLHQIAREMEMVVDDGPYPPPAVTFLGAGAGAYDLVGQNCEMVINFGMRYATNMSFLTSNNGRYVKIDPETKGVLVQNTDQHKWSFGLMGNVFASRGESGDVLRITARKRIGEEGSFTECIRKALRDIYGDSQIISLGGVFAIKSGKARYHIMPDFPPEEGLPFEDREQFNNWLTYHDFRAPMTCMTVLHSADPKKNLGLRMEHTHAFSTVGENTGGHYHYDLDDEEEIEYEGYFNTAKVLYRIDKPEHSLEEILHR